MLPDNDQKPSLLTRRGVLRLLALTGASLAAGSGTSHAFMDFFSTYQDVPRGVLTKFDIPTEWLPQLGSLLPSYADYLQRFKFRQMSVRQVIAPHAKSHGSVHNTLPPRFMWKNIRSTLRVVDSLADRLDVPVKEIVSVYRTPAYNARCPGAKSNSYHLLQQRDGYCVHLPAGQGGSDGPRHALRRLVQRRRGTLRKLHPHRYPRYQRGLVTASGRAA